MDLLAVGACHSPLMVGDQALSNAAFDEEGRPMLLEMKAIPEFVRQGAPSLRWNDTLIASEIWAMVRCRAMI